MPVEFQRQEQQNQQPQTNQEAIEAIKRGLFKQSINYEDEREDDLTRYQLDLSTTKADIAHWLNGDTPNTDPKTGKTTWEINNDDRFRSLNEYGIREVMRILNMYLTKDVIMSNIKEERIEEICEVIGDELNDLFFTKYDEIGLDDAKLKNYSSIIVPIIHLIYFVTMRAEGGKERKSVTENREVSSAEITHIEGQPNRGFRLNPLGGSRR